MSKWAERISECYRKDGRRKRIVESPSSAIRAIEWGAQIGKRLEPYRCAECGYVHMGGRPGWNTRANIAARLADREDA